MLEEVRVHKSIVHYVSVAGCLGYDVLDADGTAKDTQVLFQLLVV
ncbi:hypothetical protein CRYPA_1198 [uncultured Candidatus Thioglobus sp.]|nr:hypothetical protein CRYPA_1198 [uncultured Candidatus Thioglobus sp.]